jgi:hypothetical protein
MPENSCIRSRSDFGGCSLAEGTGTSGDDYPQGDIRLGERFIADAYHARADSGLSAWRRDPRALLSFGMDAVDLALVIRASYADAAQQVTLERRQGSFQNLPSYRRQCDEPHLLERASCIGHLDPDCLVLSGACTFDAAVVPLQIGYIDHRVWIAGVWHFFGSLAEDLERQLRLPDR